jgi:hypothetical protein
MLIEYLDGMSMEIGELRKRAKEIKKKYDETLDKDLRLELIGMEHKLKAKKHQLWEAIYENMDEFRFMRKHFPELFLVYAEDENIGKYLMVKEWLVDFEPVPKDKAEKMLQGLKETLKALDKAKKSTVHWPHWKEHLNEDDIQMLAGIGINERTDRDEFQALVANARRDVTRQGWIVLLNEPFVIKHVNRFLDRLKQSIIEEAKAKVMVHESNGQGTLTENQARQEYRKAVHERKLSERLCRHLLMANPAFLRKFKSQRMIWRDTVIANFMNRFLSEINPPELNEKEWVKEMKKKLA